MKLTKDQVNTILNNAPTGTDKSQVLDGLIKRGYELEGVDTAAARAQIAAKENPQPTVKPLGDRLGEVGTQAADKIGADLGGGSSYAEVPRRAVDATAQAFSVVPKAAFELLPESVRKAFTDIADHVGKFTQAHVIDPIAETDLIKGAATSGETKGLEEALGTAAGAGEIASTIAAADVGGVKAPTIAAEGAKKGLNEAVSALDGITAVGSQGIKEATTKALDPASIMQRVARVTKAKQAAFEERAGAPVGKYLVDRHIFGTPDKIVDQLYERFQKSKAEADGALSKLPGSYKSSAVGGMLKELEARERGVSAPGAVSKDMEQVIALNKKMKGEGLTMSEVNEVKRLYERNVKLDYVRENVPSKVEKANNLDSAVREWQVSMANQLGLKNLPEINKETMLARQLADDLGTEYAGSAGNNAISITDWITLSGGTPANAAMFLTKQALTSKTLMSETAKALSGKTPKVAAPKAEMGTPTIDNYRTFIERTAKP